MKTQFEQTELEREFDETTELEVGQNKAVSRSENQQYIFEKNIFETINDAVGGDYCLAYRICTIFSGMTVRFPSKMHKMKLAEIMFERGFERQEILDATGISRASYYNILRRKMARKRSEKIELLKEYYKNTGDDKQATKPKSSKKTSPVNNRMEGNDIDDVDNSTANPVVHSTARSSTVVQDYSKIDDAVAVGSVGSSTN